jgi:pimeloyl-ACP methyl ester carboxylesterase
MKRRNNRITAIFFCLGAASQCQAFFGVMAPRAKSKTNTPKQIDESFVIPDVIAAGITEQLCIDTAQRMKRVKVPVSERIHPDGLVGISYSYWSLSNKKKNLPPVVLIHGFDSNNLEFRRLGSKLAARGMDTYAVDLLGWGFSQLENVSDFSASAKVEALQSFIRTIVLKENRIGGFCIAGASLGGAAAIETATINENCKGLILIDAQGFVDGIGPMASLPTPIAKIGVGVLKSVPLRSSANQMSYFDKNTFATDEAVVVGRLHCMQDGWSDALVNFMQSGGFSPSKFVSQVPVPSLILWGRQDGILDGAEFAPKFLEALPDARIRWIENCGHVPHLEQPEETADSILEFVDSLSRQRKTSENAIEGSSSEWVARGLGIAGISAIAASFAADWLPTF